MKPVQAFFDEFLLYSGQYALFYILMNFSSEGGLYFTNFGHTALLVILILQTVMLVAWGQQPVYRFVFSLTAPLAYSLIEAREGLDFLLNMGHLFFWVFALVVGLIQAIQLVTRSRWQRGVLEFLSILSTVSAFAFIYFYYDLKLGYDQQVAAGTLTAAVAQDRLNIENFLPSLAIFLKDASHVFILLGALVLGIMITVGRLKIQALTDRVSDLFGRYIDKGIRDRILGEGQSISEKGRVTVLFSDIRGFTALSEQFEPRQVTDMLNLYFTAWNQAARAQGGVIDKYIGDAVMILFGLGAKGTDNEVQAVRSAVDCAQDFLAALPRLQEELLDKGLPVLGGVGVGINYGEVILGDLGSEDRKNFTVIGDTVNTAARLEAACRELATNLLVSGSVYQVLTDAQQADFEARGNARLKGKAEAVPVFGLRSRSD